ncbi:hypothetical protein KIK04_00825 [Paenibacillus sp. 481]|nr:hypothetical protein [Paenibacillus sp. 481]UHA73750.1 hypothetical protein KIK04_00825 [Paenibacillus sp. 481]
MNLYAYVMNNPLKYIDPSGHEAALKIDWRQFQRESFRVIEGGAKGGSKGGRAGGFLGGVLGGFFGSLFNPSPAGESQQDINKDFSKISKLPLLSLQSAEKYRKDKTGRYVYRALNTTDMGNLMQGKGILSKHRIPNIEWTLLQHITYTKSSSGEGRSIGFDPWISTTRNLDYAMKLNTVGDKRGVVVIDITKATSRREDPFFVFDGVNEYASALATGEEELSFYQYINQSAIQGYLP